MKKTLVGLGIALGVTLIIMWIVRRSIVESVVFKHFKWAEFDSPSLMPDDAGKEVYEKNGKSYIKDSGEDNMSLEFVYMLDKARNILEKEWNKINPASKIVFSINSGYRTPHYNATLPGAATTSSHMSGLGADISYASYDKGQIEAIVKALSEVGFRRFGMYGTHLHVDIDDSKTTPTAWFTSPKYSKLDINPMDYIT